jgi:hypothetical protein
LLELAKHFLELAEKRSASVPLTAGHQLVGISLLFTRKFVEARTHLNDAVARYDPSDHHIFATRFGQDVRVVMLLRRAQSLWVLGYPEAAITERLRSQIRIVRLRVRGRSVLQLH